MALPKKLRDSARARPVDARIAKKCECHRDVDVERHLQGLRCTTQRASRYRQVAQPCHDYVRVAGGGRPWGRSIDGKSLRSFTDFGDAEGSDGLFIESSANQQLNATMRRGDDTVILRSTPV